MRTEQESGEILKACVRENMENVKPTPNSPTDYFAEPESKGCLR